MSEKSFPSKPDKTLSSESDTSSTGDADESAIAGVNPKTDRPLRKKLLVFLKWAGIALLFLVLLLLLFRDVIVRGVVPVVGSMATGTTVKLDSFSSSFNGRVRLGGLAVGNPANYEKENALEIESISVKVNLKSLFSDKIEVDEIIIEGLKVDYEIRLDGSCNLTDIEKNTERLGGDSEASNSSQPSEDKSDTTTTESASKVDKAPKRIVIHLIQVTDSTFCLSSPLLKSSMAVPVPPIELTEFDGGSSIRESIQTVYNKIMLIILQSTGVVVDQLGNLGESLKDVGGSLLESVQDGTKPVGELLNRLGGLIKQNNEKTEQKPNSDSPQNLSKRDSENEGEVFQGLKNIFSLDASDKSKSK